MSYLWTNAASTVKRLNGHGKEKTEEESPLTLAHLTPKPKPKSCVLVDSPKRNSPSKTRKRKRVLCEEDNAVAFYSTPHRLASFKSAMENWDVDMKIGGNEEMLDLTQNADDEDEIRYRDTMQTPLLTMKGEHSALINVSMDMDMTSDSMQVDLNTGLARQLMMYSRELGLGGPEESKHVVQSQKQEEKPTKTTSTKPVFPKPPGSTKAKPEDRPRSKDSAAKKPVLSASKPKTYSPSTRPPKPRPIECSDAFSMPPADSAVGVEPPTSSSASPVAQPVVSSSRLDLTIETTAPSELSVPSKREEKSPEKKSVVTPLSSPSKISSACFPPTVAIQAAQAPSPDAYAVASTSYAIHLPLTSSDCDPTAVAGSSLPLSSPPPERWVASPTIASPPKPSTFQLPVVFPPVSLPTQVVPSSSDVDSAALTALSTQIDHVPPLFTENPSSSLPVVVETSPESSTTASPTLPSVPLPSSSSTDHTSAEYNSKSKSAVSTDKPSSSTPATTSSN
ncbi:hypothetical protein V5O48_012547 [Marasmius crinis-equi]|uniref:Uncharacterized protein n=1 Tax=Marasmius crinis-equi TaxID=585013 RepID=A0ABR3F2G9_9AGAR